MLQPTSCGPGPPELKLSCQSYKIKYNNNNNNNNSSYNIHGVHSNNNNCYVYIKEEGTAEEGDNADKKDEKQKKPDEVAKKNEEIQENIKQFVLMQQQKEKQPNKIHRIYTNCHLKCYEINNNNSNNNSSTNISSNIINNKKNNHHYNNNNNNNNNSNNKNKNMNKNNKNKDDKHHEKYEMCHFKEDNDHDNNNDDFDDDNDEKEAEDDNFRKNFPIKFDLTTNGIMATMTMATSTIEATTTQIAKTCSTQFKKKRKKKKKRQKKKNTKNLYDSNISSSSSSSYNSHYINPQHSNTGLLKLIVDAFSINFLRSQFNKIATNRYGKEFEIVKNRNDKQNINTNITNTITNHQCIQVILLLLFLGLFTQTMPRVTAEKSKHYYMQSLCKNHFLQQLYRKIDGAVLWSQNERNLDCIITFQTHSILQRFMLRFDMLQLDCNDHLYVYDGAHAVSTPKMDISCRQTKQTVSSMLTRTNFVTLKYVTDNWGTDANGFKLVITSVKDPKHTCKDFTCSSNGFCIHPDLLCDGINHCSDNSDESVHNLCQNESNSTVFGMDMIWFVLIMVSVLLIISAIIVAISICVCRRQDDNQTISQTTTTAMQLHHTAEANGSSKHLHYTHGGGNTLTREHTQLPLMSGNWHHPAGPYGYHHILHNYMKMATKVRPIWCFLVNFVN